MNLYLAQVLSIIIIFYAGYIVAGAIIEEKVLKTVIAYPVGLSILAISGLLILLLGVNYNAVSVSILSILLIVIAVVASKHLGIANIKYEMKFEIIVFCIILLTAAVSVSGLIPLSISNDSIYYYSLYPQTIVADGGYRLSYDVFLTDVGQSVAVINTIPFLFGFKEAFGIHTAMMLNFIAFFVWICRQRIGKSKIAILVVVGVIITCTPFMVMAQWVLANAYFMEFLFMIFALSIIAADKNNNGLFIIIMIFVVAASMMRMEATLILGLLILCISRLNLENATLIKSYVVPSIILIVPYYAILYIKLGVDPLYSFLDIKNALMQVGFLIIIGLYCGAIRNKRMLLLQGEWFSYILIGALGLVNIVLFVYDHDKYIENIKAFFINIVYGNGWGFFLFFVLLLLLLLPSKWEINTNELFCICYVLLVVAILFARDGALRVGSGDSGNRVMLQITPFVVYTLMDRIVHVFFGGEDESKE